MLEYTPLALVPVLAFLLLSNNGPYHKGPNSDHFNGKRFYNPNGVKHKHLSDVIKWKLTEKKARWPNHRDLIQYDRPPERVPGQELRISFVGHATVLIQTHGMNILTDPVWSKRVGPFSWLGPKRIHDPGIKLQDLPPIDIILISHNHYDHLDIFTVKKICKRDNPEVIVGLGVDVVIKRATSTPISITALDWKETIKINDEISISFMPAIHWSGRGAFDRNKSLWGAFVITPRSGGPIYFGGDTAYSDHFKKAGESHGPFRLALLPIGRYGPEWFMNTAHINPRQAVQAHLDLHAHITIPIHYGTFQLTNEAVDEPTKLWQAAAITCPAPTENFIVLPPGHAAHIPDIPAKSRKPS